MSRLAPLFSVLMLLCACGSSDPPEAKQVPVETAPAPNVVLISLDTLGAKHLSCYGYARETSPNIDALAKDAILFRSAYSTSTKTAESHMSMFTSLYPSVHRVATSRNKKKVRPLGDTVTTLAEILQAAGYTTVGFHSGGYVSAEYGFDRGFDVYKRSNQEEAIKWLQEHGSKDRFFLFYHTYAVHDPYTPTAPFDTMFDSDYRGKIIHDRAKLASGGWKRLTDSFWKQIDKSDPAEVEHVVALYDGAIRQLDAALSGLFATIERHAPNTLLILLADHGEEFGEHGGFTHKYLYDETLRVPLIIRAPGGPRGVVVQERVSLIDLAPTILSMLRLPLLEQFQGEPLLDDHFKLKGGEREVFSELPKFRLKSLINRDKKIMLKDDRWELYDLANDAGERNNLIREEDPDEEQSGAAVLRQRLGQYTAANQALAKTLPGAKKEAALSEEVLDQLKALGYLE